MVTITEHVYVVRDDGIGAGEPIIKGTRTPVRAIVETWRMGVLAEDIPAHLPHLTLAQVFDALSYFADHMDEIMGYIEKNRVPEELLYRAKENNAPLRQRLPRRRHRRAPRKAHPCPWSRRGHHPGSW